MNHSIYRTAILIQLVLATVPAAAATKVFLLGGQSNMAGVGGYDAPIPSPYDAPQPNVKFWDGESNSWIALRPGFGYPFEGKTTFGPEITFGYTLHQTVFPNDSIYLVKYGVTSTSLGGDWNPNAADMCYATFKALATAAVNDLRSKNLSPVIAGMIWMQGEADSTDADMAVAYAANLTGFIATVRRDFATSDMPFVVGRILDRGNVGSDTVRVALETVPGQVGHASWIDTDDLQLAYAGHYGTQGQLLLGERFANEFIQTPEPSTLILGGSGALVLARCSWLRRRLARRRTHRNA
jgi:hypothetical protein